MATYTVTVSVEQERALIDEMGSTAKVQVWLDNIVNNKARRRVDEVLLRETDKRPDRMTLAEKETEMSGLTQDGDKKLRAVIQ
jgi:hypothetical protein